jgi:hypothetical protein
VSLFLASCAQAISQPTSTPQDVSTVVVTEIFTPTEQTGTPHFTSTPLPAATRRATWTDSDFTKTVSVTPLASLTRAPTSKASKTPSPTITGTNTLYVRPRSGPPRTPTPLSFKCQIAKSYPLWGQVFRPRTDFIATWRIFNVGANMWHKDDVEFAFISGTKMHNRDRQDVVFYYTVYKGDKIDFQVHLKTPKEPGTYVTSFGLRKTNKTEPFCSLDIMVEVKK